MTEQDIEEARAYYDKVLEVLGKRRAEYQALEDEYNKIKREMITSASVGVTSSAAQLAAGAAYTKKCKEKLLELEKGMKQHKHSVDQADERLKFAIEDLAELGINPEEFGA